MIFIPQSFAADNETAVNGTDYYFDIDAASDGNGTLEAPFKNFTDDRIVDGSTLHLADGEYVLEKSRSFADISFYGAGANSTVLNGNGNTLTVTGIVNFNNITLTNLRIVNQATLNATDTHFRELIPSKVDIYNNRFGGAIYAPSNKNIYLDGCVLFNNSADYGGAIYVNGGNLIVLNSIFYENTAYNFGGAILGDSRVKIIINNTRFICDSSIDDAGGAIYSKNSDITASNVEFANCSATFGSALTALYTSLNLTNVTLRDNTAKYEGGAIYQFYGSLTMNSSRFISNTARNGAGIYLNDVNVVNFTSNEFTHNTASNYAGAIYSIQSNVNITQTIFENNSAYKFSDFYNASGVNITLGNGNYTMYVLNQISNLTIPERYDLRDYGWVTPVKDQQSGGNCWAFSPIAALESCILKATGEVLDLSEENVKNLMAIYSDYGRQKFTPNNGGNSDMAIAYLVSWLGPVSESMDGYDDKSDLSAVLTSLIHVQNVLFLNRNNYTDNDAIKQAILNYGAVSTTMYFDNSYLRVWSGNRMGHYCTKDTNPNHAVTIVGWDDDIVVPNAPGKGAWIVKNSWGESWLSSYGQNGYFYVSYYDTEFARPGDYSSFTFILNDTQHFDKNYQYDISGPTDYFYYAANTVWYENAFYSTDNEFLAGVSTYFNQDTDWELFIYVNSRLQLMQSGFSSPGYYTINLDYPVPLAEGDLFEILFRITTKGDVGFPITEAISTIKYTYTPGISFVSYDGLHFNDLYDLEWMGYPGHSYITQVACIKGFTQLITLNSTSEPLNITYDSLDLFDISLNLLDENNNTVKNGNVTFTVNGENHTVGVYMGIASLKVPFSLGINNISWSFISPNYYSCSGSETYEVSPIHLDLNITVLEDFNNAFVTFTFSQPITENVTLSVNGVNRTVEVVNGTFHLNFTDLDYGEYNISMCVLREIYDCQNSTAFFVNVKRTYLNVSDFKTVYNGGEVYAIQLLDEFGIPLEGAQISYILNNVTYFNSTDSNGVIYVPIDLQTGNYTISVFFDGDDTHVKCQNSSNITVDKSRTSVNITSVAYDSFDLFNICVGVLDQFGNVPDCGEIMLEVNGRNFTVSHGESLRVPLVLGKNNISAAFVAPNYYESSQEMTFEVLPIPLAMNITVLQDFNNAFVNFTLSQPINENVSVSVNGVNQTVGAVNGSFYLELKDLEYGDNTVSAFVVRDIYDCHNSTVFFVNVKRTYIEAKDFETVYNSGMMYSVRLYDEFNMSVANRQIEFIVGDNVYFNTTDENGIASIAVSLKNSAYPVAVSFKGDDLYIKSQNSSLITVKSSISLPQNSNYAMNSNYVFSLTNRYGNPLADSVVSITVSDKTYDVETDANGKAIFEIPFSSGSFKITVENPETGEKLSQDIVVSKRITENVDMSFYYGKNPSFKVRVCDDSGNFVSGIIVKFKVNGKSYEVSSDNDGWAGIKIKLNVGKYTVTAEHKGFKVSNKINVKTTLITKNKKFKKAKTIKYTAKLLNKNGKAYKGKKITFKIKGKIYKAKTNSKGIATIKIKNLRVGKYKVTAKFSKLTSTSKITIKK